MRSSRQTTPKRPAEAIGAGRLPKPGGALYPNGGVSYPFRCVKWVAECRECHNRVVDPAVC